ncbi:MAG: HAD family hydrolase [Lentisphaeria bacterium]
MSMQSENRSISVDVALIDIDGTITAPIRNKDFAVSPLEHLLRLMTQSEYVSQEAALAKIRQVGDIETSCIFKLLAPLGISAELYWNVLQQDVKAGMIIPEDAVFFIKALKGKNIKLFSATTNSRMATLLKLSVGGLGDINGSPYFDGYFGGDSFADPLGKWSPEFFPSILKAGRFDPERTLMIGDDPARDMLPALQAGIAHVAIIDRHQTENILHKGGVIFINSLEFLYHMLEPVPRHIQEMGGAKPS